MARALLDSGTLPEGTTEEAVTTALQRAQQLGLRPMDPTEAMTGKPDPLGLPRCGSCSNALAIERKPDGRCGHCGGFFEVLYYTAQDGGELGPAYAVMADDTAEGVARSQASRWEPVNLWPRSLDGVINATSQAAWRSVGHGPHEVYRPDGGLLARFEGGRRVDLPPKAAQ
jgi:hypothetical protein